MLDETLRGTNALVVETFDENCHIFYLVEREKKFFLQLENTSNYIKKLIMKPDLWIFFEEDGYEHWTRLLKPLDSSQKNVLAKNYYIDPTIFHTLINYKLISYSKAMADLYDLPIVYSRDIGYHHNDYKRQRNSKKEKVLEKLRSGKFN